jgi:nuclear cap-binding protein subunit 2
MAQLYIDAEPKKEGYYDKKSGMTREAWFDALDVTRTCYVGNLSFYTSEEQIAEYFMKVGEVYKITMGLHRFNKSPCGFCFVEYYTRAQCLSACALLNGSVFDDRTIRVDPDVGFQDGRQFGRGQSGGQWRDDFREDYDPARGGQGRSLLKRLEEDPKQQVFVGSRGKGGEEDGGSRKRSFDGKGKGKGKGKPNKWRRHSEPY